MGRWFRQIIFVYSGGQINVLLQNTDTNLPGWYQLRWEAEGLTLSSHHRKSWNLFENLTINTQLGKYHHKTCCMLSSQESIVKLDRSAALCLLHFCSNAAFTPLFLLISLHSFSPPVSSLSVPCLCKSHWSIDRRKVTELYWTLIGHVCSPMSLLTAANHWQLIYLFVSIS